MSEETAAWIWLRGELAGLGTIREDLLETYWRLEQWVPTIVGYNRQSPQPMRSTRAILIGGGSGDEIRFTIYDLTQGPATPVGLAELAMDTARGNGMCPAPGTAIPLSPTCRDITPSLPGYVFRAGCDGGSQTWEG